MNKKRVFYKIIYEFEAETLFFEALFHQVFSVCYLGRSHTLVPEVLFMCEKQRKTCVSSQRPASLIFSENSILRYVFVQKQAISKSISLEAFFWRS